MSPTTPRDQSTPSLTASPPWLGVLEQLLRRTSDGQARAAKLGAPPSAAATGAAARAHSRLLIALDNRTSRGDRLVSELIEDAVELIVAVAELSEAPGRSGQDRRADLIDQLRRCLNAHEDAVLSGEMTYEVRSEEGEAPAVRIRRAIAGLSIAPAISQIELTSLRIAATDLNSLLLRAAANVTAGGSAAQAPEQRPPGLDRILGSITHELAAHARQAERPVAVRGDVAAHQLAAALRVPIAREAMAELASGATVEPVVVQSVRDAWLRLATCEYLAVTALDSQLPTSTHDQGVAGGADAIVQAATNVLCGARLVTRARAFHHSRAWRHQTVGLSYALEAYVAGIRGHAPSLAQAQLIALTRLVRAVAAIAALDLCRADLIASNGRVARRFNRDHAG
jgi:hypothetical protein